MCQLACRAAPARFMRIGGTSLPGLGQLRSQPGTDRRCALRSGVGDLDDLLPGIPSGLHDGWFPGLDGAGRRPRSSVARDDRFRSRDRDPRERRHHHVPDAPSRERWPLSALQGCAEPSQLQDRGLGTSSRRPHHVRRPAERRLGLPIGSAAAHRSRERTHLPPRYHGSGRPVDRSCPMHVSSSPSSLIHPGVRSASATISEASTCASARRLSIPVLGPPRSLVKRAPGGRRPPPA